MFKPKRVIFEKGTLDTETGKSIYNKVREDKDAEIITSAAANKVKSSIPGKDLFEQYREGKQTLVVSTKKSLKFQTCKPSANYQLPLVSGCMGRCEYCYLNTQLGDKPFTRVFVNVDDILNQAKKYIEERLQDVTIFEGAATSDPIPIEPYTHTLKRVIEFFGKEEMGRFRFVTKFNDVDTLLDAKHNGHTEIRFSINTDRVIKTYEHHTSSIKKRIEAAAKVAKVGYRVGFIIAPVFLYENWKADYTKLLEDLKEELPSEIEKDVIFEVISHRYTTKAKNRILEIYPETTLPMDDENRKFKYGQFGYGKYVYTKEELAEMKEFFKVELNRVFPNAMVKYII